jgi:hypothetical protein
MKSANEHAVPLENDSIPHVLEWFHTGNLHPLLSMSLHQKNASLTHFLYRTFLLSFMLISLKIALDSHMSPELLPTITFLPIYL